MEKIKAGQVNASDEFQYGGRGNTKGPRPAVLARLVLFPRGVVQVVDASNGGVIDQVRTGTLLWVAPKEWERPAKATKKKVAKKPAAPVPSEPDEPLTEPGELRTEEQQEQDAPKVVATFIPSCGCPWEGRKRVHRVECPERDADGPVGVAGPVSEVPAPRAAEEAASGPVEPAVSPHQRELSDQARRYPTGLLWFGSDLQHAARTGVPAVIERLPHTGGKWAVRAIVDGKPGRVLETLRARNLVWCAPLAKGERPVVETGPEFPRLTVTEWRQAKVPANWIDLALTGNTDQARVWWSRRCDRRAATGL